MTGFTDFHTHLLPGVDDGSPDAAVTLQMLRASTAQGITTLVATPHFYPQRHNPDAFVIRRREAFTQMLEAARGQTVLPRLRLGAEVRYYPGMGDSQAIQALAISGSRAILVEMPPAPWTRPMLRDLERIYTRQGLVPIIAHLDRYISPLLHRNLPRTLQSLPVAVQANADFFLRRSTARYALDLLEQDQIHLLGSDCHNLTDRAPNLGPAMEAIRRKAGEDVIRRIRFRSETILSPECEIDELFQEVSI